MQYKTTQEQERAANGIGEERTCEEIEEGTAGQGRMTKKNRKQDMTGY